MWVLPSRQIQFAAALSLALMAQANLLMASFSPCGLPFGHIHSGIGRIDAAALNAHLAMEASCRVGTPHHPAASGDNARVISEPRDESLAHTLANLSLLISFAALLSRIVLLAAGDLSTRLREHRFASSPHLWRPPDPPPRVVPIYTAL